MTPKGSSETTVTVVGLGGGRVDDLTLGAWGQLASGRPLLLTDPHPVAHELAARGIGYDMLDGAGDHAARALQWSSDRVDPIIAVPGSLLSSTRFAEIAQAAEAAGIELQPIASVGERLGPLDELVDSAKTAGLAADAGKAFERLVAVMARLRRPGGCPWDAEQTHESLAVHLLEETYEALAAIDKGQLQELAGELGDVLLQVVFHSEIASEQHHFDAASVTRALTDKLISRHPHVFGDEMAETASDVVVTWERRKTEERGEDLTADIPEAMPALIYAYKVLRRAGEESRARLPAEMMDRIAPLIEGPDASDAVGWLLLGVVATSMRSGVDPEGALRRAVLRYVGSAVDPHS